MRAAWAAVCVGTVSLFAGAAYIHSEMNSRLTRIEGRLDVIDGRLSERISGIDKRLEKLEDRFNRAGVDTDTTLDGGAPLQWDGGASPQWEPRFIGDSLDVEVTRSYLDRMAQDVKFALHSDQGLFVAVRVIYREPREAAFAESRAAEVVKFLVAQQVPQNRIKTATALNHAALQWTPDDAGFSALTGSNTTVSLQRQW
jgi:hypothetical protein